MTVDRIVVGITGASGIPIAVRTVEALAEHADVYAVVTDAAESVMAHESGSREAAMGTICEGATEVYAEDAIHAPVASGSFDTDGMVIVPASMNTVAAVATGRSDSLVTRAADVTLKERRRLVVVPRESPLSQLHLENLTKLAELGVDVVPPMLGFYFDPEEPGDFVDHVVGKILERFDLDHDRYDEWEPS
ncbi:3-octaprenyl-4-hydroxybenzoate carboxy-lyase UbiX protein [Halorhabdus tiamatea SARL4B]|uniref:Flavin prenyltransferase UbiX n=1 Tax=Halorhabdus tiamatea SARL4B TaxID=1033806 RepID=F7PH91_9EURY|nr:UbiX family flavin prenyltransferase [Halorhabdus tiamatea]ERJ05573.1 3-octaprenyl-4-hydroxybenzoate carboxy-lyase UbiX protein [Halorhabdus tiamatea SARL4B]CCQ32510.1 3-polyprenyl-4-hydroxybenzoate carboxy-lyase UbiX [Halorhabdus tiamatea SARL4B]